MIRIPQLRSTFDRDYIRFLEGELSRKRNRRSPTRGNPDRAENRTTLGASRRPWWEHPVFLVFLAVAGSAVISFFVAQWQVGQAKSQEDLGNEISAEVARQLTPVNQEIAEVQKEIGELDEKNGISKMTQPSLAPSATDGSPVLKRLDVLFPEALKMQPAALSGIAAALNSASASKESIPAPTLARVRTVLSMQRPESPEFWDAAIAYVNYLGLSREASVSPHAFAEMQARQCIYNADSVGMVVSRSVLTGCNQQIDNGIDWDHTTFRDAFILYAGGPVKMEASKFVDCVFVIRVSGQPVDSVKPLIEAIIAGTDSTGVTAGDVAAS